MKYILTPSFLLFFCHSYIFGQIYTDKVVGKKMKHYETVLVVKPVKNSFFLVIPFIGSKPAVGFVLGGVAQYTFKRKELKDKYSIVNLGVTYTSEKQLLINAKNSILLKNNRIYLNGDYRLCLFSQVNYGLGMNFIPTERENPNFVV